MGEKMGKCVFCFKFADNDAILIITRIDPAVF